MRRDRDRPDTGTAAAVGNAKRLVQIEMADIHAEIAGAAEADLRGEIRAIHINLAAVRVDDFRRLDNRVLERAVRARVRDHRARKIIGVLVGLLAQVGDVDVAIRVARDDDDLHAGHHRAGGIRAVRGNGMRQMRR